jgi:predicted transcriptional regulator
LSARAAARLASFGFRRVYRYEAGKVDWFAAGLAREGRDARVPRAADVARRDVPTCRIADRLADVRDRMRAGGWELSVVVDDDRVVLGVVRMADAAGDGATSIEAVMRPSPPTVRPNVMAGEVPGYLAKRRVREALVTTSDGVLVGLLRDAA